MEEEWSLDQTLAYGNGGGEDSFFKSAGSEGLSEIVLECIGGDFGRVSMLDR